MRGTHFPKKLPYADEKYKNNNIIIIKKFLLLEKKCDARIYIVLDAQGGTAGENIIPTFGIYKIYKYNYGFWLIFLVSQNYGNVSALFLEGLFLTRFFLTQNFRSFRREFCLTQNYWINIRRNVLT